MNDLAQSMPLKISYSERDEKYWIGVGDEVHWFDGPLAAQDGLRQLEIEQAEQRKVKEIAVWLRGRSIPVDRLANQIEAKFGKKGK